MTRRMLTVVLATTVLALLLGAASPRPAQAAVSFVDKQVQAGGLLIQTYVNAYGMAHGFVFPDPAMVKKGGGLEDATRIWPSNPWTGKLMGAGDVCLHAAQQRHRLHPDHAPLERQVRLQGNHAAVAQD